MWGEGKKFERKNKIYRMGEKSMDNILDGAKENKDFAKEIVDWLLSGEEFELRFDSIEMAKAVNSELKLRGGVVEDTGLISDSDISAAKILRHYLEYPQDFSSITFPSIEVMNSFFKILPYGKTAVLGILESGKSDLEDLHATREERSGYITKPIYSRDTEDQNVLPTEKPEDLENKKAA